MHILYALQLLILIFSYITAQLCFFFILFILKQETMHRTAKGFMALKWMKPCKQNICDNTNYSIFIMYNRLDLPTVFFLCLFVLLFSETAKTCGLTGLSSCRISRCDISDISVLHACCCCLLHNTNTERFFVLSRPGFNSILFFASF